VEKVRDEIFQTLKGLICATMCPALSLYLAQQVIAAEAVFALDCQKCVIGTMVF
jgi:hypothetical protein